MKTYKLWFRNGSKERTTTSKVRAVQIARDVLGADRLYRGAEYQTDETDGEERRAVTAMDLWQDKASASREMGLSADCVITW